MPKAAFDNVTANHIVVRDVVVLLLLSLRHQHMNFFKFIKVPRQMFYLEPERRGVFSSYRLATALSIHDTPLVMHRDGN